jgi:hypothetical protein
VAFYAWNGLPWYTQTQGSYFEWYHWPSQLEGEAKWSSDDVSFQVPYPPTPNAHQELLHVHR